MKKHLLMMAAVTLSLPTAVASQNYFNRPESAVYDAERNRYLVSNYANGLIIAVDETGTQTVFASGKSSSAGLHIIDDTVYVGCGSQGVIAYNLVTGELVMDLAIPGSLLLNDIDSDTSGNIYVSDPYGDKVYKISLADRTYSTLLDPITWPNGVLFDRQSNRLLVCCSTTRFIISVDIEDGSYYGLTYLSQGHLDGLAQDDFGNIYVSAQGPEVVYRYDKTFSQPLKLISKGHHGPADIFYDRINDVLVVPNISATNVDFIDFSQPDFFLVGQTSAEISGNGNGHANPGETVELSVVAYNHGQDVVNVTGELRCLDPLVTVLGEAAGFGSGIAMDEEAVTQTPFVVSVDPSCPEPHTALAEVDFYVDGEYAVTDSCFLLVGDTKGYDDDLEGGGLGWSHRAMTRPYVDEWHPESHRAHSGGTSWKFGGAASENYAHYGDGALVTPPFQLPPNATLSFWHWIDAQAASSSGAWHGGLVMILSENNPTWTQIAPVGGYPYGVISNVASPFAENTGCFSGTHDWSQVEFDLSSYTGTAQIMFRFGTTGGGSGEGWYVDDITVVGQLCCSNRVGDANGLGGDEPTIGDVSTMIDAKFISGTCDDIIECLSEADVNQSGGLYPSCDDITIGDISVLIDYLFITGTGLGLPECL